MGEIWAIVWEAYGKQATVFVLLCVGYELTFSHQFDDALTAAYEIEGHFVQGALSLVEFRHLVNHLWPFWLFETLRGINPDLQVVAFLHWLDLLCAAASVMIFYCFLSEIIEATFISLAATFAYATAQCVWIFTGTGRLYTTSMLLAFAAYYLGLQMEKAPSERRRWLIHMASATMVCFACFFWLVHVFNVIGVGLLLLLLSDKVTWRRRLGYIGLYGAACILIGVVITVSCLLYVQIPVTRTGLSSWMGASKTPPMQFGLHGLMAAAYGQANGILATPQLPYMVHGLMLKDAVLIHLGSMTWQMSKFIFIWLLLIFVYLYPWVMFKRASRRQRTLILALYIPLAINMFFALGWLGTDLQRFLPTMLSQIGLGALAVEDLLCRVSRPRMVGALAFTILTFIAAVNLTESVLPSQREFTVLPEQMKAIRPYVGRGDLLVTFGRDLDNTYNTACMFYADTNCITLTNDGFTYNWDRPDWRAAFDQQLRDTRHRGARLFVCDRLAIGYNPSQAAWSEKQHPRPTVRQFAEFLRTDYCVTPAFYLGSLQYFEVKPLMASCRE